MVHIDAVEQAAAEGARVTVECPYEFSLGERGTRRDFQREPPQS